MIERFFSTSILPSGEGVDDAGTRGGGGAFGDSMESPRPQLVYMYRFVRIVRAGAGVWRVLGAGRGVRVGNTGKLLP